MVQGLCARRAQRGGHSRGGHSRGGHSRGGRRGTRRDAAVPRRRQSRLLVLVLVVLVVLVLVLVLLALRLEGWTRALAADEGQAGRGALTFAEAAVPVHVPRGGLLATGRKAAADFVQARALEVRQDLFGTHAHARTENARKGGINCMQG